jgi:outer membrane murein-binding lipoprotein Lpp
MNPAQRIATAVCLLALCVGGCGSPNRANIELRKQVQQLQAQVNELQVEHEADHRTITGLRQRTSALPTLSADRLDRLFTTGGLEFGRLTGGADLDPNKPGDEGLAIYVVPTDHSGEKLKAAGSFDIDAFDLAEPSDPLIGHWHFDLQQSKSAWTGALLQYNYVLICPWQKKLPRHPGITVKVTFFDELTQTPFTGQRVVQINVPPDH